MKGALTMPKEKLMPELVGICKKISYGATEIPVSDRGFTDLNPIMLGFEQPFAGKSYGPDKREYHLIHYVVSGKGRFTTPRGDYDVRAGQCFMIRPGEQTIYTADRLEPWVYIWVGLNGRLTSELDTLPDLFNAPDPSLFTSMLEYEGNNCDREMYIAGKCFLLLSSLRGYKEVASEKKYYGSNRYARAAANYILQVYMGAFSIEKLAERLHVNRRYLSRVFKKEYGVTVKEYLTSLRMDHAKTLLRSGRTVSEAALLCGYSDTLGFSKMYKKHHGCPPSAEKNKKDPAEPLPPRTDNPPEPAQTSSAKPLPPDKTTPDSGESEIFSAREKR